MSALFWDLTQRQSSWTAWPLNLGPIRCPETSLKNYDARLCKFSKEWRSQKGTICPNTYMKFFKRIECFSCVIPYMFSRKTPISEETKNKHAKSSMRIRSSYIFLPLSISIILWQTARLNTLQHEEIQQAFFLARFLVFAFGLTWEMFVYLVCFWCVFLESLTLYSWKSSVHIFTLYLTHTKGSAVSSFCAYVVSSLCDYNMASFFTFQCNVNH